MFVPASFEVMHLSTLEVFVCFCVYEHGYVYVCLLTPLPNSLVNIYIHVQGHVCSLSVHRLSWQWGK